MTLPFIIRRGSSLIELLVVVAITGTLVALSVPAVQSAREASRRAACLNNLKQTVLAVNHFEQCEQRFPPGATASPNHAWASFLLPYLDQQAVFDHYDFQVDFDHANNALAVRQRIATFVCLSAPHRPAAQTGPFGPCDYSPMTDVDVNTIAAGWVTPRPQNQGALQQMPWGVTPIHRCDVTDGMSQTLAIVEVAGRPNLWQKGVAVGTTTPIGWANYDSRTPVNLDGATFDGKTLPGPCGVNCTNIHEIYSFHRGGANVAFLDGHVRLVRDTMDLNTLADLTTRAGGEVVDEGQ